MSQSVVLPDAAKLRPSDIAAILFAIREPAIVLDAAFRVVEANAAFCDTFGIAPSGVHGQSVFELGDGEWDTPDLHRLLESELPQMRFVRDYIIAHPWEIVRDRPIRINASWLSDAELIMLTITFADAQPSVGSAKPDSEPHLITAINSLPVGVGFTDRTGRFVLANPEMRRFALQAVPSADATRQERWLGYYPDGRRIPPSDFPAARALRGETVQPGIEFSFRDDDGNEIWTRIAAVPLRDAAGAVTGAAVVVSDITSHKLVEATLRASERHARRTLGELEATYKMAPIGLCVLDTKLRFVRINDRLAEMNGVPAAAHIGRTPREVVPVVADQAEEALRRVLDSGEPLLNIEFTGETPARPGVKGIWNESLFPLRDDDGRIIAINVVAEEITERKRNEERLKLLAREVDHRSRNVLTLVATLVRLTHAESIEAYRENLLGRLDSLARSHQLLAAGRWQGADLRDMVSHELAAYRTDESARVAIEGAAVQVQPDAAQALSMVVHELATNAAKYGALSVRGGRVTVSWNLSGETLRLVWSETGGPAVPPPARAGLGSDIIVRSVKHQLDGDVTMDWRPSGLVCALTIPATNVVKP